MIRTDMDMDMDAFGYFDLAPFATVIHPGSDSELWTISEMAEMWRCRIKTQNVMSSVLSGLGIARKCRGVNGRYAIAILKNSLQLSSV